jgi:hypothetical protein
MRLSAKAIEDLKIALQKSYGVDFLKKLSEEEIEKIGLLVLHTRMELLKMKFANPELSTASV